MRRPAARARWWYDMGGGCEPAGGMSMTKQAPHPCQLRQSLDMPGWILRQTVHRPREALPPSTAWRWANPLR
jgi:hypothetical protein